MNLFKPTISTTPQIFRLRPCASPIVTFSRTIRIRTSDGDARPPEGHVLERKDQRDGSLDPQAQSAKGSMAADQKERPSYVHGELYKEGSDGTGGASSQGTRDDATGPSWWVALRQKLGFGISEEEGKHGSKSGNTKS